MERKIARRLQVLQEAQANNLIEGKGMAADAYAAMLQRAQEAISDDEFVRREKILWRQTWAR